MVSVARIYQVVTYVISSVQLAPHTWWCGRRRRTRRARRSRTRRRVAAGRDL